MKIQVYHLNIIATQEDVDHVNRVGWGGHPKFTMHADITVFGGDPRGRQAVRCAWSEGFYKAAGPEWEVYTTDVLSALEEVYHNTQNLTKGGWCPGGRERSSSVGDIFVVDGDRGFMVASMGFVEIPLRGVAA